MNKKVLTDAQLYQKCREIGGLCRKYRNQFLGMLPEVMWRKLYLRHGMSSIYEFAAKLACISRDTVNEVLRIHDHLEAAPLLQEKLVNGEIGYTKLRAVSTIVQPETQQLWLEKVESMSKPTLEVYVQELKRQGTAERTGILPVRSIRCGLPGKECDFVPFSVKVKSQTLAKMRVMKERLEKKLKKPMNWDEAFEEIIKMLDKAKLKRRPQKKMPTTRAMLPQAGVQKSQLHPAAATSAKIKSLFEEKTPKRYIPAAIRHEVEDKTNGICYFPACKKPGKIFHHIHRFALDPHHESKSIVSLCKPHEQIAHQTLIRDESAPPENWQVSMVPNRSDPTSKEKYLIDRLVQKYRRISNNSEVKRS